MFHHHRLVVHRCPLTHRRRMACHRQMLHELLHRLAEAADRSADLHSL